MGVPGLFLGASTYVIASDPQERQGSHAHTQTGRLRGGDASRRRACRQLFLGLPRARARAEQAEVRKEHPWVESVSERRGNNGSPVLFLVPSLGRARAGQRPLDLSLFSLHLESFPSFLLRVSSFLQLRLGPFNIFSFSFSFLCTCATVCVWGLAFVACKSHSG